MNTKQKGGVVMVIIIVLVVVSLGFFILSKPFPSKNSLIASDAPIPEEDFTPTPTPTLLPPVKEDAVISSLLSSWNSLQKTFSIKAGESGTYNTPADVQFISSSKLLVHYDDGLTDHISLLQYKNGKFSELKHIATMKMFTEDEWQVFFKANGDPAYTVLNYTTGIPAGDNYLTFDTLTRVTENSMVR